MQDEVKQAAEAAEPTIDFESDEPLVCNRSQEGDKPCDSCQ